MNIIAIICEYNPFHNGHAAQLARLRASYPDCTVLCIMSGCFTQRGEPALMPAYDRARAAVCCGADLVLELSQPWASGSAEFFAAGGVAIADRLGVVDGLAFGCESDDLAAPVRVAEQLDSPQFRAALAGAPADPGEGAAAHTARIWRSCFGEDGGMLSQPNNLLAVQYCLALRRRGSAIRPLPMQRLGSGYHDEALNQANPSATAVRAALRGGEAWDALAPYLPAPSLHVLQEAVSAGRAPVFADRLGQAILAHYRLADENALAACASMGGGLNHRLCAAAREAASLEEMLALAATKVYTNTRIRRAILHGMLGVTEDDLRAEPSAVLLLAANARGRALLADLRRTARIPIVTKPADLPRFAQSRQSELHARAAALYTLAMPKAASSGEFVKYAPFFAN